MNRWSSGWWLTLAGLVLNLVGSGLMAFDVLNMTDQQILESGDLVLGGTLEENRQLPRVQALFRQVARARLGMLLVTLGFALQSFAMFFSTGRQELVDSAAVRSAPMQAPTPVPERLPERPSLRGALMVGAIALAVLLVVKCGLPKRIGPHEEA